MRLLKCRMNLRSRAPFCLSFMLDSLFFSPRAAAASFRAFHARNRSRIFAKDSRGEPSLFALTQDNERIVKAAISAVREGDYALGPAEKHIIEIDKARTIHHFSWVDTFIIFHLARSLFAAVSSELPDCLFSYRPGRSAAGALGRVKKFLAVDGTSSFVLRRDVKSFGDEMSHEWLMRDFSRWGSSSPNLIKLFRSICEFRLRDGEISERGLPGGHYLQLVMENLYLIDLDRELSGRPDSLYIRFGDDIFFASRSSGACSEGAAAIDKEVARRGIRLNESKSLTFEFCDPSRGLGRGDAGLERLSNFTYLGSQVFWDGTLAIPRKKMSVLRKYIRFRLGALERAMAGAPPYERVRAAAAAVKNIFDAYFEDQSEDSPLSGIFHEVRNEAQLRELDHWIMALVLKTGFGGFKRGNFRRVSAKDLRAMGLPSILHLRRTVGVPS